MSGSKNCPKISGFGSAVDLFFSASGYSSFLTRLFNLSNILRRMGSNNGNVAKGYASSYKFGPRLLPKNFDWLSLSTTQLWRQPHC